MSTNAVDFDRIAAAWLADGPTELADRVLDAALEEVHLTHQRRRWFRAPWRTSTMTKFAGLAAAGVAVLAIGTFAVLIRPASDNQGDPPASPFHSPSTASPSAASPSSSPPEVTAPPEVTGLIAFSRVANANAAIMVTAPDGTGMAPLILAPGNNVQPAWSPDGSRIAWASAGGIRIAAPNGTGVVQLTDDRRDRDPAWSPDGALIVFASNRDGDFEIYEQPVNGGGLRQMTDNDVEDTHPSWSPTADAIVFSSNRAGTSDLWTMGPNGENLRQLTLEGDAEDAPAWSPDGSRIAFTSDRDGATSFVYLMNADGSGIERLLAGGEGEHDPAWSPDGRYIALSKPQTGTGAAIYIVDVTTHRVVGTLGQERAEFNFPAWRTP